MSKNLSFVALILVFLFTAASVGFFALGYVKVINRTRIHNSDSDKSYSISDNNNRSSSNDNMSLIRILCYGDSLTAGYQSFGTYSPYGRFLQVSIGVEEK